jgi:hypothetical protein
MSGKILVLAWLVVACALPEFVAWREPVPQGAPLAALPYKSGNWQGIDSKLRPEQTLLQAVGGKYDDQIFRIYKNPAGLEIEAQIFYCATRRPHNRLTTSLNFVNCLHGGYQQVALTTLALKPDLPVGYIVVRKGEAAAALMYWLQSPGKTSADGFSHALWQYEQNLQLSRADGCFVKLAVAGERTPEKEAALAELAKLLHGKIETWLLARK